MLAIAAAVSTGAVVAGVVAGPGVMSCVERGDFNECIGETFFGSPPAIAEADDAAEPQEETVVTAVEPEPVEEEVVVEEEAVAEVAVTIAPTFALVRVEPDGSAVIAGAASPSSEIQLFANDELIGSETTEAGGDFVYITGEPLPSGGVELRLLDVASGAFATTSIVIIVQEDRTSEPLVVASEPGQASEILQGMDAEPTVVAEEPVEAAEVVEEIVEQPAEPVAEPVEVVVAEEPAVESEVPAVEEDVLEVAQSDEPATEEVVSEPVVEIAEEPVAAEVDEPVAAAVEEPAVDSVEEPAVEIAEVEPEAVLEEPVVEEASAPAIVIVQPTIDAVEIDGDRNFFAGGGTSGLAARLYVENRPVGTTEVQDGRWLIEAINVLTAPTQRIRIDMLNADGSVAGRAEVDFVIDIPLEEPVAEPVETPVVVATQEPEPAAEEAAAEQPVSVADEETVADVPVAVAEIEAVEEDVVQEPVPTLVGTSDGTRTTSGQVIIRRGDNLWTIARRVYGEGLRYTQIYEANANTIRNPDLIYPGQVFDLPGTDVVIGEDE